MSISTGGMEILHDRFRAAVHTEFFIDSPDVSADCADAQIQLRRDLFVRKTFSQQTQDLLFARGELLDQRFFLPGGAFAVAPEKFRRACVAGLLFGQLCFVGP